VQAEANDNCFLKSLDVNESEHDEPADGVRAGGGKQRRLVMNVRTKVRAGSANKRSY